MSVFFGRLHARKFRRGAAWSSLPPALATLAAVLVGPWLYAAWQQASPPPRSGPGPRGSAGDTAAALPVATLQARRVNVIQQTRTFSGLVHPRRAGDLSFARPGVVRKVLVGEGEAVQAGQVLAELDLSRLQQKRNLLDEALQRARGDLEAWEADPAIRTVNDMRLRIQAIRGDLDRLDAQLARMQAAAPAPPLDQLRSQQQRIAALDQAQREERGQTLAQQIRQLEAELQDLDLELQEGVLKAPYDGVIAARYATEGAVVSPANAAVRIVESPQLQAWIGLPLAVAEKLKVGDEMEITVGDSAWNAVVEAVAPEVELTSVTKTVVLGFQAGGAASPGQVARLQLRLEAPLDGVWLPLSALERDLHGVWSVLVVEGPVGNQRLSKRAVEIVYVEGERALTRGGLVGGEQVVAEGTHRVVEGQPVTARSTPPLPPPQLPGESQ